MNNITKEQFEELCKNHDWTYFMSDDHSKYVKGQKSAETLNNIRSLAKDFDEIFHKHSLAAWGGVE